MAERKHLGLIFYYDEKWIGGTYYYLNLIHALNTLEDDQKPWITVITTDKNTYRFVTNETSYPYLIYQRITYNKKLEIALNVLLQKLFNRRIRLKRLFRSFKMLFPAETGNAMTRNENIKCYWIPDFQELYYPEYFSKDELIRRKKERKKIAGIARKIILSSQDVCNDFFNQFPDSKAEVKVIPFAVTHPDFSGLDFISIQQKFGIRNNYFYCPNQFFTHKNHIIILKAAKELKDILTDFQFVFSGKEDDFRNPGHVRNLKRLVRDNGLEEHIRFLGFIDRKEMLKIMEKSMAVIQPSLFEGWSTVIEDAKAMNKFIFASDLRVHREQLSDNCIFFDPHDFVTLSRQLLLFSKSGAEIVSNNYRKNIRNFGESFISFMNQ
jgi:glycosyltransferase involved in cell wall biosynthesis